MTEINHAQREVIDEILYHQFPGTTTIACCIVTKSGFTVVGHAACAKGDRFDRAFGEEKALNSALFRLRDLENYARVRISNMF